MMKIYRMIDANINRVSEGIRVLEDIARFQMDNQKLSKEFRECRHLVRKTFDKEEMLLSRDTINDVGIITTAESKLDRKTDLEQLIKSNFKRVQEGLRVVEDSLKIIGYDNISKQYESIRYKSYQLEKMMNLKVYPKENQIYLILGEKFSKGRSNIEVLEEALKAGVRIIQYREKEKTKSEKIIECTELMKLTHKYNGIFIVNDDIDIAIIIKADGIHLGQEDLPINLAKKLVSNMFIGVSTHNIEQARKAVEEGADYIGCGPMFETSTKENIEPSKGVDFLKEVSEEIKIPFVAIGGIKLSNIKLLKEAKYNQIAMISEIVGSDKIIDKINLIKDEMEK